MMIKKKSKTVKNGAEPDQNNTIGLLILNKLKVTSTKNWEWKKKDKNKRRMRKDRDSDSVSKFELDTNFTQKMQEKHD